MVPTEEGMYQHYKQIAESVNIGIMVYNFPGPTGSWIKKYYAEVTMIDGGSSGMLRYAWIDQDLKKEMGY